MSVCQACYGFGEHEFHIFVMSCGRNRLEMITSPFEARSYEKITVDPNGRYLAADSMQGEC